MDIQSQVASLAASPSGQEKAHVLRAYRRQQELEARKIEKRSDGSPKQCNNADVLEQDNCDPKVHHSCYFRFDFSKTDKPLRSAGCSDKDRKGEKWDDGICFATKGSTYVECFCDDKDRCGADRIEIMKRAQGAYNDKNPTPTTTTTTTSSPSHENASSGNNSSMIWYVGAPLAGFLAAGAIGYGGYKLAKRYMAKRKQSQMRLLYQPIVEDIIAARKDAGRELSYTWNEVKQKDGPPKKGLLSQSSDTTFLMAKADDTGSAPAPAAVPAPSDDEDSDSDSYVLPVVTGNKSPDALCSDDILIVAMPAPTEVVKWAKDIRSEGVRRLVFLGHVGEMVPCLFPISQNVAKKNQKKMKKMSDVGRTQSNDVIRFTDENDTSDTATFTYSARESIGEALGLEKMKLELEVGSGTTELEVYSCTAYTTAGGITSFAPCARLVLSLAEKKCKTAVLAASSCDFRPSSLLISYRLFSDATQGYAVDRSSRLKEAFIGRRDMHKTMHTKEYRSTLAVVLCAFQMEAAFDGDLKHAIEGYMQNAAAAPIIRQKKSKKPKKSGKK